MINKLDLENQGAKYLWEQAERAKLYLQPRIGVDRLQSIALRLEVLESVVLEHGLGVEVDHQIALRLRVKLPIDKPL